MTNEPADDAANEPRAARPDEPQDLAAADEPQDMLAPTEPAGGTAPEDDTTTAERAAAATERLGADSDAPESDSSPYGADSPPPDGAMPPPEGGPVPPQTGGYASQFGLVRPLQGRYIAGVCAALGRATNTDPVLWRVVLPVLTVVGGLGGLLYILGWLLIPAEGDSASPFEALIGRGHSSTSKAWTLVLSIVALSAMIGGFTSGPSSRFLLFAAVIGGAVLLVTSRDPRSGWTPSRSDPNRPSWTTPAWTPPPAAGQAWTPAPTTEAAYQAPFAPHGPFASSGAFAPTTPYPTAIINPVDPQPPIATPVAVPRPPKPTKARRAILSSVVLAVGLLGALDAANVASIPVPVYFAVALGVLGVGMIVAAFFGRVRGPVTLGFFLAVGLLISSIVSGLNGNFGSANYYRPATFADLDTNYQDSVGRTTLDLSDLDFSKPDAPPTISIRLNVGSVRVILPPTVDATVNGQVDVGDVAVFSHHDGGVGNNPFSYTDLGPDGKGGGSVVLDTNVNVGKVEVTR